MNPEHKRSWFISKRRVIVCAAEIDLIATALAAYRVQAEEHHDSEAQRQYVEKVEQRWSKLLNIYKR